MCKVSVITIAYNAEKYIEETMLSVIAQKYNDFEYIIKDGGSSDDTNNIVQDVKKRYDKKNIIRHITTRDKGIYSAMNEAANYASGEWVVFMNAGDTFYDQNVLLNIFSRQYDNEIGVLYGHVLWKLTGNRGFVQTYNENTMKKGGSLCHQSVLEKRELLIQKPFDINLKILADREHFLQLQSDGIKFQRINMIVAKEDRNGISSVNYPQFYREATIISDRYNLKYKRKNILIGRIKMFIKMFIPQIEEVAMIRNALKKID